MKNFKVSILSIATVMIIASCTKADLPTPESENIIGEWEWVESSGGIAGTLIKASDVDYSKQLVFKENGKYRKCTNDKKDSRGNFEISSSTIDRYTLTLVKEESFGTLDLRFSGQDTISLYPKDCNDCFADTYVRK
jgi:hypothetical protein